MSASGARGPRADGSSRAGPAPRDLILFLPVLGAAVASARGHRGVALVLVAVALAAVVARIVLGPRVHEPIARLVRALEAALTWAMVGLLWCLIVVPGWLVHQVRSIGGRRPGEAGGWVASPKVGRLSRAFGSPAGSERTRGSMVLQALGLVVVLLVADLAVGVTWQHVTRSRVGEALGIGRDGTHHDPRADAPALADAPWADGQRRDMQRLPQAYWPFVGNRPVDFSSETVNTHGWERRSYQATGDDDRPVVAFFGGSTTFGEGQRDEHTIPSEIARLAEAAGTPIRVINYGQRSWTAWQESILFDQVTAQPDAQDLPDLVVFYDGANEVLQQEQASTAGWPTIYNVDGIARSLTGRDAGASTADGFTGRSVAGQLSDWYTSRSMVFRAARSIRGAFGESRATEPAPQRTDLDQVGRDAATVYLRASDIVRSTAERRGIGVHLFWQPVPDWRRNVAVVTATDLVREDDDIAVIIDALDGHQDVYFDQVHTNEVGARIVAERMWATLAPEVARAR
ncbi:MAG: SGNH/GDSL hydrolase family protein [Acidimicrobiales bacterium]|nr:SGNH/GDSL hydrolase family protein [Acidimicrobiales bacterium]